MIRTRKARRSYAVAERYVQRFNARQHAVHVTVFLGIVAAAILDHYFQMKEAALWLSVGTNGVWVFHG